MPAPSTPDELRQIHRKRRAAIDSEQQASNAAALCQRLLALPAVQQAQHISAYIAIRGEISLGDVMARLSEQGKQLYLPILRGDAMHFSPWQPHEPLLKKGFGLLEPDSPESAWIPATHLDLVLTPLVVFDEHCNRIGQGGGYYDRTFSFRKDNTSKPTLLGVAHEQQRESQLDAEPWDVPLDMIATNAALYSR